MFTDLKEEFRLWLINECGLSKKSASDVVCRCNRLDRKVLESLDSAVLSVSNYTVAMKDIKNYAILNKKANQTKYTLTSTLRLAMRKYCEFRNPEEFHLYPRGYNV